MNKQQVALIKGDITRIEADAIVNAANNTLLGGGGVDGAIHRAAGPGLYKECLLLKGCETGQAKITGAYNLKAKFIIHTVGPVWYGGYKDETDLLASCYQACLALAKKNRVRTMAFPGISTGVYGFPRDLAAMIAVNETRRFMNRNSFPEKVTFVAFDDESYECYRKILEK